MNKDFNLSIKKLNILIEYINKCEIDENELYEKMVDTFSYIGAFYDYTDKKALTKEQNVDLKCCSVLNNVFKHKKELNGSIEELKIIKYGTDLSHCLLDAPFGDVVYFQNSLYLENMRDSNNYKYYKKNIENQRLDIFLSKVEKVLGELND